jgi:hypothetical protein
MNAWIPNTVTLPGLSAIPASQTDAPISKKFPVTAGGSKNMVVLITVSAAAGTVTAQLRSSMGNGTPVNATGKTVALTGAGNFYIKINSNVDTTAGLLPLLSLGEVVVTTNGASSVTITSVQTLMEE